MKLLKLLTTTAFSILSLSLIAFSVQATDQISPRIIGGADSTESYPWMVALSINGNIALPDCGASLIGTNTVLTAAHCVVDSSKKVLPAEDITLKLGEVDLSIESSSEEFRQVSKVVVHQDYVADTFENDIAILTFDDASALTPIKIASPTKPSVKIGDMMRVMGWGDINITFDETYPKMLNEVDVPLVTQSKCIDAYENVQNTSIKPTQMCAGIEKGGKDSCKGDSGGPLVFKSNNVWYQMGLVSFGPTTCAQQGFYGVYTRLSSFNSWVDCAKAGTCGDTSGEETGPDEPETQFNFFTFLFDTLAFFFGLFFPAS